MTFADALRLVRIVPFFNPSLGQSLVITVTKSAETLETGSCRLIFRFLGKGRAPGSRFSVSRSPGRIPVVLESPISISSSMKSSSSHSERGSGKLSELQLGKRAG